MDNSAKDSSKIQDMFSSIAHRYDFLNRLLSLGRDQYWRRFAVYQLPKMDKALFLDVATGTGDVAIEIAKRYPSGVKVIGVDFSDKMLEIGREKIRKLGYQERIELRFGDLNSLPFEEEIFDAAIIAFGIRNIQNYNQGIKEMKRVVKEGGKVVILEFTSSQKRFFRLPYRIYIKRILPVIGEIFSGRRGAYRYLPESVLGFLTPEELKKAMEEARLRDVKYHNLTFGITTVYVGIK